MTRHTAFGKASAIGQTPDALLAILTHRVENDNALGPQSHGVGPYSEGWLTSRKSALQSTRSTATCPALRGCPKIVSRCAAPQPALTRYKLLEIERRCKAGSVTPAQNNCASQAIIADHTHVNDGAAGGARGGIG